jgi:hypothetical protein
VTDESDREVLGRFLEQLGAEMITRAQQLRSEPTASGELHLSGTGTLTATAAAVTTAASVATAYAATVYTTRIDPTLVQRVITILGRSGQFVAGAAFSELIGDQVHPTLEQLAKLGEMVLHHLPR